MKVTVHDKAKPKTTAEAVPAADGKLVYVTDEKGRKIGLRQLPFLEEFRIVEAVGPERAANQTYMGMINPLLLIAEIDGEPIDVPRTHPQIEALIKRAGREGFMAALEGMKEFATDQKELETKIINGEGTPGSETGSGS